MNVTEDEYSRRDSAGLEERQGAAIERLVDLAEAGAARVAMDAALLGEIQALGLSERVTLWRQLEPDAAAPSPFGRHGEWLPIRSLGSPTPSPDTLANLSWRRPSLHVCDAGRYGTLVHETTPRGAPGTTWGDAVDFEDTQDRIGALLLLVASLDAARNPGPEGTDAWLEALAPLLPRWHEGEDGETAA